MDIELDDIERAQTYQELSERLNHRHPQKYKVIQVLRKEMSDTADLSNSEEGQEKRIDYLQDIFQKQIILQIDNERTENSQDTWKLQAQEQVLKELPDNPQWRDKFIEVADNVPDQSIQEAQSIIAFELGEKLRDMACSLFKEYGGLVDIFTMYKLDQEAIQSILKRAKDNNTLKAVGLTNRELEGLCQFFEIEDCDIPRRQAWNLKEIAMKKIKRYVQDTEHNVAV